MSPTATIVGRSGAFRPALGRTPHGPAERTIPRCIGGCGTECEDGHLLCPGCWRAIGSRLRAQFHRHEPMSVGDHQALLIDIEAACAAQRRRNR